MRWSEDDRWRNEFFTELATLAKDINNKVLKDDFTHAEKAMVKSMKHNDFAKMKKKAMRVLFNRKIVKMIKNPRVRNKTITLYVFNKMKLKENWVVFESFMGRNCSGQPKYVYKYLQEAYGDKYKCIWVVDRKGVEIPGKHKTCKRFSLKYYYYMNRSKYWVNNMRQPLSIPRREETVMLATWHGTPLKRLVFDMDDVHSANPRYKDIVFKQTRAWDYLYPTILSQQKDSRAVSDLKKKRFWNTDILLMTQCMHLTEKSRQQRLKRNLEFQRIRKLFFMLQHGEMTSSTKQDSMVLNLILMLTDFRKSLGMNMYCY